MKRIIVLTTLACAAATLSARTIHYAYSEAGNRVKRFTERVETEDPEKKIEEKETACDSLPENLISVLPNPTDGKLTVCLGKQSEDQKSTLTLVKMNRQTILKRETSQQNIGINIIDREPSIYILRIDIDGEFSEQKIIKN